jgi:hypothetical protein
MKTRGEAFLRTSCVTLSLKSDNVMESKHSSFCERGVDSLGASTETFWSVDI